MFSRIELLIGKDNVDRLNKSRVAVFGLGGVGSYVAEALARSGVGQLLLVDADTVAISNINRQLPALHSTVGELKTQVMRTRLADINPQCKVDIISQLYTPGDFVNFIDIPVDCIVDAIDSMPAKVDLLVNAHKRGITIFSAMGTGKKMDPTKLKVADISKTDTCPLARKLRHELKKHSVVKGITVVFSTEQPLERSIALPIITSMVFVPASAGLLLGSLVIKELLKIKH